MTSGLPPPLLTESLACSTSALSSTAISGVAFFTTSFLSFACLFCWGNPVWHYPGGSLLYARISDARSAVHLDVALDITCRRSGCVPFQHGPYQCVFVKNIIPVCAQLAKPFSSRPTSTSLVELIRTFGLHKFETGGYFCPFILACTRSNESSK